jgi:hypothetical protein
VNDDGSWKGYSFTLDVDTEIYLGVTVYNARMYAFGCKASTSYGNSYTYGNMLLYSSANVLLASVAVQDDDGMDFTYIQDLPAGTYSVWLKMNWQTVDVPDYTLRAYAPHSITFS